MQVTPINERAATYDEESWKPSEEEAVKNKKDLSRSNDVRQSKTKRVKNYLKKCKTALGPSKSASLEVSSCDDNVSSCSSWYMESQIIDNLNRCEINELTEIFEDAHSVKAGDGRGVYQVANIIEVRGPSTTESSASDSSCDRKKTVEESYLRESQAESESTKNGIETTSPNLSKQQDQDDGEVSRLSTEERMLEDGESVSFAI